MTRRIFKYQILNFDFFFFFFFSLGGSDHWVQPADKPPSGPGFFQATLHVDGPPEDTFIKLPVGYAS